MKVHRVYTYSTFSGGTETTNLVRECLLNCAIVEKNGALAEREVHDKGIIKACVYLPYI